MKYKFCIPYLLLLSACSEQLDSPVVQQEETVEQNVVTFTHNVVASQQATRADETILNKGETSIETGKHVGIFGCYTGQNKWEDLVKLSKEEKETPTILLRQPDVQRTGNGRRERYSNLFPPDFLAEQSVDCRPFTT